MVYNGIIKLIAFGDLLFEGPKLAPAITLVQAVAKL
jgi:hypothetical protein